MSLNLDKTSMLKRLKPKKTRTKFMITLILVSLPPLVFLGFFSYNITKDTLLTYNSQTNETQLATSSEVADLLFRNVLSLHRYVVYNHAVRDELREIKKGNIETETDSDSMNRRTRLVNTLTQIVTENSVDIRYVTSMCVLDLNYTAYCFGKTDDAGIYEGTNKREMIESSPWYQQVYDAKGRVTFFSHNVLEGNTNSFSTVKLYRDSSTIEGETLGVLIITMSTTMFQPVFNSGNNEGQYIAVDFTNDPANIVYADHSNQLPDLDLTNIDSLKQSLSNQDYITSDYRNTITKWQFMHVIEKDVLLRDSTKIGMVTTVSASLIAMLALIVAYVISGTITEPLLKVKKMMMNWKQGISSKDYHFNDDEIGSLGMTFTNIVKENENLSTMLYRSEIKEREAELRALQAQIKPHFLYNTLNSIYLMAKIKKTDEVAQMALSLSESFKLSLNKGKETLPLFKELQHIEHYMTIQNIRYNHRFTTHIEIDPQMMSIDILKLVLQPLVENAIYHGLEAKVGPGDIWIEGKIIGPELYFKIQDNGVGMKDIQATERGYGIKNVRERLKLYYGPSVRFQITSQMNEGTTIEIYVTPFPVEEVTDHVKGSSM